MDLIDTHCHIQSAGKAVGEKGTRELWARAPDRDPEAIIARAEEAGVGTMICVGCTLEDSLLAVDFVRDRPQCFASIGIHPHEAKDYADDPELLAAFGKLAGQPKVVAVGECGLDYYYEHSPRPAQLAVLRYQIELALEHDLPLIFHVREAFDDFWPVFESYTGNGRQLRGVLHSFTDSVRNLERALGHGLYIGVNGIATFAKDEAQREMYRAVPLEKLLLETDSPFLTPAPDRGTICEPYHIRVIAEFLGGHRQESLDALAAATTYNAHQLFRVKS